jgi:glucose-6-phosphate-specific signal transduction histidine kinase
MKRTIEYATCLELLPSLLTRFGCFMQSMIYAKKLKLWFEYSSTMETATRYNEDYEMKMYFIIMELSNNIIKHSNAVNAFISIEEKKQITIHSCSR